MLRAKDSLTQTLRKTLLIQAAVTGIAVVIALVVKTPGFAVALAYGGLVTIIASTLHAWRMLKIVVPDDDNEPIPGQTMVTTEVFKGALLKYTAIIGLLALGMGYFRLEGLAVLIGFSMAYLGFVFSGGYAPRSRPNK